MLKVVSSVFHSLTNIKKKTECSCSTNTFHIKVTLNYPGCGREFKATVGADLQTLGKALARRGTYKQIADATFRCSPLKPFLIKKTLQALGKECNDLCSKKKAISAT